MAVTGDWSTDDIPEHLTWMAELEVDGLTVGSRAFANYEYHSRRVAGNGGGVFVYDSLVFRFDPSFRDAWPTSGPVYPGSIVRIFARPTGVYAEPVVVAVLRLVSHAHLTDESPGEVDELVWKTATSTAFRPVVIVAIRLDDGRLDELTVDGLDASSVVRALRTNLRPGPVELVPWLTERRTTPPVYYSPNSGYESAASRAWLSGA